MQDRCLKVSAKEAKKRFKNGYWENFCKTKSEKLAQAEVEGKTEEEVESIFKRQAKNDIKLKFGVLTEDDVLYSEVCEILCSNEIILNPIKRLINNELYESLDEKDKQDYIIKLSSKFQEMRERYNKENAMIS